MSFDVFEDWAAAFAYGMVKESDLEVLYHLAPAVPDLELLIWNQIEHEPASLEMYHWHTSPDRTRGMCALTPEESYPCGTAHCLAGWACFLGSAHDLEKEYFPDLVAGAIWVKSTGRVPPNFFQTNAEARAELRARVLG